MGNWRMDWRLGRQFSTLENIKGIRRLDLDLVGIWTGQPVIKKEYRGLNEVRDDGAFWMCWMDYVTLFSTFTFSKLPNLVSII